jgi:ectoine hydroxylase-related dioxygenase (phytanoyl-CoA dioxygenase family)
MALFLNGSVYFICLVANLCEPKEELDKMDERSFPCLNSEHRVTTDQINSFRMNGFLILKNVFTRDEIEPFRWEIRKVSSELNQERRRLEDRDAYGKAFLQTLNLRLHSDGIMQLVSSRRIGKLVADLLGVNGVRIFHEQSLFKESSDGSNPTPWHQDQYYWPLKELTTCGFWLPLVDIVEGMGGMKWASGTHMHGFLGQHAISDESQAYYEDYIRAHNCQVVEGVPMSVGDISFHYGWTLHSAGANTSNVLREAMIGTYYADGMRVMQPTNSSQENDRVKYLGGRQPGELADSDLNRLIYSRIQ